MDWKDVVRSVAPTISGALATAGGPGGMLAGAGLAALANAICGGATGDPVKDEAAVQAALAGGLTPELRAKIVDADNALKLAMVQAGVREKEISATIETAYISDADAARRAHAHNMGVLALGYGINVFSYLCVGGVLWGCFRLMGSAAGITLDPGIAAMLGGIVGAAVQWLLSNAAQANGFFFGSSPGSRQLSREMGQAVSTAVSAAGRRP